MVWVPSFRGFQIGALVLTLELYPLIVETMGPDVPEPEALGGPTETWPRVGSNPSNINYQQSKPKHCSGGKESTYKMFRKGA